MGITVETEQVRRAREVRETHDLTAATDADWDFYLAQAAARRAGGSAKIAASGVWVN